MTKDGGDLQEFGVLYRRFMDAMVAEAAKETSPLFERMRAHLGGDPTRMPVVAEEFESFDHANLQVALDAYVAAPGRRADLVGVAAQNKRYMQAGLSDLLSMSGPLGRLSEGPVDYINFHLEDDRVLACVQFGLYLVSVGDARVVAFVSGPSAQMGPRPPRLRLEVMSPEPDHAAALLREVSATMRERNVYRGKVISLAPGQMGFGGAAALVRFHRLPRVARDGVVLPAGALERIERHALQFSAHAEALRAAGRSLKRGMLLYGAPGTGKTLMVMYLVGRTSSRTTILTSGLGLGFIGTIGHLARELAPATVVIEDVDLIAQERGLPGVPAQPLLFELLNQLDGLADDVDVLFVLTTNRPDILEPALAARPGRVDLVVELPIPDAESRRRLLELYSRGLTLEGVDLDRYVQRTDGASPAYIKELLRKAALLAAIEAKGPSAAVREAHLDAAMGELEAGGELAKRIVGFASSAMPLVPSVGPMRPAGFPTAASEVRRVGG